MIKLLLPLALSAALVPGAPAHAAPASPFRVLKKVNGTPSRIIMTGAKSGFAFFVRADRRKPLAYRWDGKTWRWSSLPSVVSGELGLDVEAAASGPTNVWAMISAEDEDSERGQLIRWDGRRWVKARSFPGTKLTQIAVPNRKDVWVFGRDVKTMTPLAWHYDGRAWKKTALRRDPDQLTVRTGANTLWATNAKGLLRWTGSGWKSVSVPLPGGASRWEPDALDVNGRRVTASFTKAGTGTGDGTPPESRIASWDGRRWRIEKAPARGEWLRTVLADNRGGLWVIGAASAPDTERLYHRTARGKWTTRALPYGNLNLYAKDLTRIPGSSKLVGVAGTYLVHEYGRIIVTR